MENSSFPTCVRYLFPAIFFITLLKEERIVSASELAELSMHC